jgi:uncharacterized membrane protein YvlD (DUF360 family)
MFDYGSFSLGAWLLSIIGSLIIVTVAIYLMDKLDFGIKVENFFTAFLAGIAVSVLFWLLQLVLKSLNFLSPGLVGGAVSLVVVWLLAAAALYFVALIYPGFEIKNYGRALIGVLVMGLLIIGMQAIIGLFIPG